MESRGGALWRRMVAKVGREDDEGAGVGVWSCAWVVCLYDALGEGEGEVVEVGI